MTLHLRIPLTFLLALFAPLLLLAGCSVTDSTRPAVSPPTGVGDGDKGSGAESPAAVPREIEGTKWKLNAWRNDSLDPMDFDITAEFGQSHIGGRSAVNRYNGPFETKAGTVLRIGPFMATKMAGPGPAMSAESSYLGLLEKTKSYRVRDNTLTLIDNTGRELLIFSPVDADE